jgi:Dolichyl-phosphate-mannose-protein mannosyltransferase
VRRLELPLLLLWAALASIFSVLAANVRDWNAMTDELVYERLAIAVWQHHSPVPHLHGQAVRSLAQLYPLLISPWFAHGFVPGDLVHAHIFNAWLMSSACIPAFLLARRVTGKRWAAYLIAFAAVCTPWMIYTTTLLTEVAAYPAFLWAVLGMERALSSPSVRNDALCLCGLLLAFLARTQFILLAVSLPVAFLLHERGRSVRRHPLLALVYAVLGIAVLVAVLTGHGVLRLSVYGSQASGRLVPRGAASAMTGHVADLAFGIGILPLVVGGAWLLANAVRGPAFASIGTIVSAIFVVEITKWDLHIGDFVLDRYLYYLVPLFLLAFVCALLDARRPRWSLLLPAAIVSYGFARHLQASFLWSGQFPLSTDSPIALPYKWFVRLGGGEPGASAILVAVTVGASAVFVLASRLLRPAVLTAGLAASMAVAFPLDTAYAFAKLFSRDGHAVRPLTRSESGILDWLDRAVGADARVTQVPYAVSTAYLVTLKSWRDLEFWNKSVRYAIHYPPGAYADAVIWFPNNPVTFDPRTGKASRTLTPLVVQSVGETRFRISGPVQIQRTDVMLIRADLPWRTDWLTSGLYGDGWTLPHTTAHIHVFAVPGQRGAVTRTLTVQVRAPIDQPDRGFRIAWRHGSISGKANDQSSSIEQIPVCVPPHGHADVRVSSPTTSDVGPDQSVLGAPPHRRGGVLVADISLSDEIGGTCTP